VRTLGFELPAPRAGMYLWLPIPSGYANSIDFTADLLDRTGVVVSPGSGFGKSGEGYVAGRAVRQRARLGRRDRAHEGSRHPRPDGLRRAARSRYRLLSVRQRGGAASTSFSAFAGPTAANVQPSGRSSAAPGPRPARR
jgi:hypothetical protein